MNRHFRRPPFGTGELCRNGFALSRHNRCRLVMFGLAVLAGSIRRTVLMALVSTASDAGDFATALLHARELTIPHDRPVTFRYPLC